MMATMTGRTTWIAVLAGLALAVSAAPGAGAEKPNIVFILADDLGWSDVGFNGADFYETPNIDRLARQGMIFTSAYTGGPNCSPTRACLMTGTYTPRHHIWTPGGGAKGDVRRMKLKVPVQMPFFKRSGVEPWPPNFETTNELDPAFVSVAEVLKTAGYVSGRFGKWHLGPDTQGFDYSTLGAVDDGKKRYYDDPDATERLTTAALAFIEKHRDRPFFVYLPYWDVHGPLVAHQDVVEKYKAKLARFKTARKYNPVYAAMIEAVDTGVGRVMAKLAELKLERNTLVIFSSDNGGVSSVTYNDPLRAGKGSLFEGGIRVATCMRWPAVIKPGTRCDTPITSVDFLPTLAEIAGAALPESQPVDGKSFLPLLRGERALEDRAIFWHYPLYLSGSNRTNFIPFPGGRPGEGPGWRTTPVSAIRQGDWKLLEFFEDGHVELYNLREDIGERNNLAEKMPEKARELLEKLHAWQRAVGAPIPREKNPAYRGT